LFLDEQSLSLDFFKGGLVLKFKFLLTCIFLIGSSIVASANIPDEYNCIDRPWSVLFYWGKLQETSILRALILSSKTGPNIYSFEVSRELPRNNILRSFVQPLVSTISVAGNVSYITDPAGPIYEFNHYLQFRWQHFPWDRFITNTFAVGWGVSYDSRVTTWEKRDSDNTKPLLNYLMFEGSFALPKIPQWQLVVRLHHRSGAFGLYGADNTSSNFFGAGVRYNF
jgi:hypothetical protein